MFEKEGTEFKYQRSETVYKEIIAFANTEGGVLYLGMDDSGNPIGIEDIDETYTRLTNGVRDAISPDVTRFVHSVIQENKVIRIEVQEGTSKPYYLKRRGLKPSGVYIRQGASSVPASEDRIRQRIKDSDGDDFEGRTSRNQELTFAKRKSAFENIGIEFSNEKQIGLGLRNARRNLYTNLALILSDQCPYTIKVAVFEDDDNLDFHDSKEFTGSLFEQLRDCFDYLSLLNHTASVFDGLVRVDKPDYPKEAIREALRNAVIHRDYGYSGSIIINRNDKQMEFISLGGLLPFLSVEDIKTGISELRNPKLAQVFHRLRFVEAYGTGIRKIFSFYAGCPVQPKIEVTPHVFKMTLPNQNTAEKTSRTDSETEIKNKPITKQRKKVLEYLAIYDEIDEMKLQDLLDIKSTRAYLLTRQRIENGLLLSIGRGKNKKYRLRDKK